MQIRDLLRNADRETLIDILVEYAQHDAKLTSMINVRFREPEFDEELKKIEKLIDKGLGETSNHRIRDRWGGMVFDVADVFYEIEDRINQGYIKLAFTELELLYHKLTTYFDSQGEHEISDVVKDCVAMMDTAAQEAVVQDDKDFIFERCVELAKLKVCEDYGMDSEAKILKTAVRFINEQNREKAESIIDKKEKSWFSEEYHAIRDEIREKLDL